MSDTYYDSELSAEEIEETLEAINGLISNSNNGKVLAIQNGKIIAKSASEWIEEPVLEPLSITQNGDYYPGIGVDGYNEVHVSVQSNLDALNVTENGDYYPTGSVEGFDEVHVNVEPTLETLEVTENGTYTPESGVDGWNEVTVSVSGGGGGGATKLYVYLSNEYQHGTVSCKFGSLDIQGDEIHNGKVFVLTSTGNYTITAKTPDESETHTETVTITELGGDVKKYIGRTLFLAYDNVPASILSSGYAPWNKNVSPDIAVQYPKQSGNRSITFNTIPIPASANKLFIDYYAESYSSYSWSQARCILTSSPAGAGEYGDQYVVKAINMATRPSSGTTIYPRGILEFDISDVTVDTYLNFHDYGALVSIYNVWYDSIKPDYQEKTVTGNGAYTPDEGYLALSKVTVAVPGGDLRSLTVTANGDYYPASELQAFNEVHVAVPGGLSSKVTLLDNDIIHNVFLGNSETYFNRSYSGKNTVGGIEALSNFQSDYVYHYKSGVNGDSYVRVNRNNNKVFQFLRKIPAQCQTLYLDMAADASGQAYPISTINLVDSLGITGFYSGNWSGQTLKSFTLTNDSVVDPTDGSIVIQRTSATVVPRQVIEIDLRAYNADLYLTFFACRAYLDFYGIWAE